MLGLRDPAFLGGLALRGVGGTIDEVTEDGVTYTRHRFTSSGTFQVVSGRGPVHVLTVAGGGTGGEGVGPVVFTGGGGGAGGWLLNGDDKLLATTTPFFANPGSYTITVGGAGQNTTAFGVTVTAGGGGGRFDGSGGSGGSGGGSGAEGSGGIGIAGPPRQGFNGGGPGGAGWGGSGGGAGGAGIGAEGNQAGGTGKPFLGVTYAFGGNTISTQSSNEGSGGGGGFDGGASAGRPGIVVIAYVKA